MINDNKTAHHLKIKTVFDGEVQFFLQKLAHHITKLDSDVAWAVWNLIR